MSKHIQVALAASLLLLSAACGDGSGGEPTADPGASGAPDASRPTDTTGVTDAPGPADATQTADTGPKPDFGRPDIPPAGDSSGSDIRPDPHYPPTIDTWCDAWSERWCALRARCSFPADPDADEAACRAREAADCYGEHLASRTSVRFDSQAAAACVSSLATADCATVIEALSTSFFPIPPCAAALQGTAVTGAPCHLGIECAWGNFCDFGAGCPGTCTAFATVGDTCDLMHWCDPERALCTGGFCAELPVEVGAECPDGACAAPLVCNPASGRCEGAGLPGQACSGDGNSCLAGLTCLRPDEGAAGTCAELARASEPCFKNQDCAAPAAGVVLACIGGACEVAPGAGEPCYEFLCSEAVCDTAAVPPTCAAWPEVGSPCAGGGACGASAYCDTGTCAAKKAAGVACVGPRECESGRCLGGLCVATGAPPCTP